MLKMAPSKTCSKWLPVNVLKMAPSKRAQNGATYHHVSGIPQRAVELAEALGCDVCSSLDAAPTVQVVVSTITASVGFTLPPAVLESKPLVFDVNYMYWMEALI